ncbi:MAG: hypothetical protein WCH99_17540 [Verrucomicrobiota bacterium]
MEMVLEDLVLVAHTHNPEVSVVVVAEDSVVVLAVVVVATITNNGMELYGFVAPVVVVVVLVAQFLLRQETLC